MPLAGIDSSVLLKLEIIVSTTILPWLCVNTDQDCVDTIGTRNWRVANIATFNAVARSHGNCMDFRQKGGFKWLQFHVFQSA